MEDRIKALCIVPALSRRLSFPSSNTSQRSWPNNTPRRSDTFAFAEAPHSTPNDAHRARTSADIVDYLAIGCVVAVIKTLGKSEVKGKTTDGSR